MNAPGSWHDAQVARSIYKQLEADTPEGFYIVADTAFPRGTRSIAGRIRAPLKSGEQVSANPVTQEYILAFNHQLLSYRQTAEWGMRTVQGSFGRLRVPLEISSSEHRQRLLQICIRLVNLHARCVGISQIRSVYMPIWSHDEEVWNNFGNMLFGDIHNRDRVSRFHLQIVTS